MAHTEFRRDFLLLARLFGIYFKGKLVAHEPFWGPRLCRSQRAGSATLKHCMCSANSFLKIHLKKLFA